MRLSICIPTYNRAFELRDLLASIRAQSGHDLDYEVVISDNASQDATAELVAEFIASGLPIVYDRLVENRGFDRNILNVTDCASGKFCWLFGSDDLMELGAMAKVADVLRRHPNLAGMSVGSQGYSADLTKRVFVTDNVASRFTGETMLHGRSQTAAMIGPWMGFMTSMIVRRSLWEHAVHASSIEPHLHGYVHLYLAVKMLDEHSLWLVVPDRLVGCRTANDSYLAKDEFARTRLDIVGFDLAFGEALGRSNWAYRRAMAMTVGFFIRSHFVAAKMLGASCAYWREAVPATLRMYWRYPAFWAKAAPIAIAPRPLLLIGRSIFRIAQRLRGRS